MPRKATTSKPEATPEPAAQEQEPQQPRGRCIIPAPTTGHAHALTESDVVVRSVIDPYRDTVDLIVDGPGLPPWKPGEMPFRFSSPEALIAYRAGDRSEVQQEPE